MGFQIGDRVTWTSQAQGSTTDRTGVVLAIVAPKQQVMSALLNAKDTVDFSKYASLNGAGFARDHESYVIGVPGFETRKGKLYWPNVSALRLATDEQQLARIVTELQNELVGIGGRVNSKTIVADVLSAALRRGFITLK